MRESRDVQTQEDLVLLLGELRSNLAENKADWENPTLESFLEAMQAWLADTRKGSGAELIRASSEWELIAKLLLAARIYE